MITLRTVTGDQRLPWPPDLWSSQADRDRSPIGEFSRSLQHRSDLRCCAQGIESQWRTAGPSRGGHMLLAELDAVSANTALPETEGRR
jgi:hypothetical protein